MRLNIPIGAENANEKKWLLLAFQKVLQRRDIVQCSAKPGIVEQYVQFVRLTEDNMISNWLQTIVSISRFIKNRHSVQADILLLWGDTSIRQWRVADWTEYITAMGKRSHNFLSPPACMPELIDILDIRIVRQWDNRLKHFFAIMQRRRQLEKKCLEFLLQSLSGNISKMLQLLFYSLQFLFMSNDFRHLENKWKIRWGIIEPFLECLERRYFIKCIVYFDSIEMLCVKAKPVWPCNVRRIELTDPRWVIVSRTSYIYFHDNTSKELMLTVSTLLSMIFGSGYDGWCRERKFFCDTASIFASMAIRFDDLTAESLIVCSSRSAERKLLTAVGAAKSLSAFRKLAIFLYTITTAVEARKQTIKMLFHVQVF